MPTPAVPDEQTLAALSAWRDGLIRVLSQDREGKPADALLVNLGATGAVLEVPSTGGLLYLVCHPGTPQGVKLLAERLHEELRRQPNVAMHVAILGGGDEIRQLIESVRPFFRVGPALGLHHVSPDGEVWSVGGTLSPLNRAAQAVGASLARGEELHALSTDEVTRLREAFKRSDEERRKFVRSLRSGAPLATWGLVLATVAVFVLELVWGGSESSATLFRMGSNAGVVSLSTEPWRLLTSVFLHGGPTHVLLNMWSLFALGPLLEKLVGPQRFLSLYLAGGLVGAMTSAAALAGTGASIGASGAVFALMTAALGITLRKDGLLPDAVRGGLRSALVSPVLASVAISLMPGVDKWAHLGGAALGFVLAASGLLTRGLTAPGRETKKFGAWSAIALTAVTVTVASIAASFVHGRPWDVVAAPRWTRVSLDDGLSLELPAQLPAAPVRVDTAGVKTWRFGAVDEGDPLEIAIQSHPLEAPVLRSEEESVLRTILPAIDKAAPPGHTNEAELVTIDGRPAVTQRLRIDGHDAMRAWWVVRGDRLVQLVAQRLPDEPDAWTYDWGRLARSLVRVDPRTPAPPAPAPADPAPSPVPTLDAPAAPPSP